MYTAEAIKYPNAAEGEKMARRLALVFSLADLMAKVTSYRETMDHYFKKGI